MAVAHAFVQRVLMSAPAALSACLALAGAVLTPGVGAALALPPRGPLWALAVAYAGARAGGAAAAAARAPPLVGMLLAGALLRNAAPAASALRDGMPAALASFARSLALAVILVRAGLALDAGAVRALGGACARLAALPALAEAAAAGGVASALFGMDAAWAGAAGFMLAAISPAVVVPGALALAAEGYGGRADGGDVLALVTAATPLDDALAIAGFGTCLALSSAGAGGGAAAAALAPAKLLAGIASGIALGAAVALALPPDGESDSVGTDRPAEAAAGGWRARSRALACAALHGARAARGDEVASPSALASARCALLSLAALAGVLASAELDFGGAGALAALAAAVVASAAWGGVASDPTRAVAARAAALWNGAVGPLLFGLVGASVDVGVLDGTTVARGLAVLAVGAATRFGAVMLATTRARLSSRERLFVALAWIPKVRARASDLPCEKHQRLSARH